MKLIFDFDEALCSACGACAVACMDQRDVDVLAGQEHMRKILNYESVQPPVCFSIACLHCADAPCVVGCPSRCLYKDAETGLTLYDNTNCIGCHSCSMACPYGAPTFTAEGKMEKCDGCVERVRAGLDPACVRDCPTGALTWRWGEDDEHSNLADKLPMWQAVK